MSTLPPPNQVYRLLDHYLAELQRLPDTTVRAELSDEQNALLAYLRMDKIAEDHGFAAVIAAGFGRDVFVKQPDCRTAPLADCRHRAHSRAGCRPLPPPRRRNRKSRRRRRVRRIPACRLPRLRPARRSLLPDLRRRLPKNLYLRAPPLSGLCAAAGSLKKSCPIPVGTKRKPDKTSPPQWQPENRRTEKSAPSS